MAEDVRYDAIIVGAGTSGLNIARELSKAGWHCLGLEAGKRYDRKTYPRREVDGTSQLFWGGGVELTKDCGLAILRPKVVGGGSVVNQALMDRFDDVALDDFRAASGIDWFGVDAMDEWYTRAEGNIALQTVPEERRNGNAAIFAEGFANNGYQCAPLRRGQSDCRFDEGNSCVECLSGCRIDSKQSTAITALPVAEQHGFELLDETEVRTIKEFGDHVELVALQGAPGTKRVERRFTATRVVLASGAIGNSSLLLRSGFGGGSLPALGREFYVHPQFMNMAIYREPVRAFDGPLQNYKSADPGFRRQGFKLENVFAGPVSIAMLLPGFAREHAEVMRNFENLGCIEVCVRDTNPGRITVNRKGITRIDKTMNAEDKRRRAAGAAAIRNVFNSTGAQRIVEGEMGIGLHLMGGCRIGTDPATSVVDPSFTVRGTSRIHAADSSIFPNAPGINPALTISAISLRASQTILQEVSA